jgi:nucleoid DNA-binding protein
VTKKEIVKTISDEIGLTQLKTKKIVQRTFDAIVETLVDETKRQIDKGCEEGTLGRIELRNFGVFEVKKRAARKARNPRTGERVNVEAKFVVTFKPGKEMEEKVRELQERSKSRSDGTGPAGSPDVGMPGANTQMPGSYGTPEGYGNNPGGPQ